MEVHPPVSRVDIELFLQQLEEQFTGTARLYLVGGATLAFEEIIAETLDIELDWEVSPDELTSLIRHIRDIRAELDISVYEDPPDARIPLPAGFADRHLFVGRFGALEVFHFDLYSVTLSRLARGREQDYADTLALLGAKRLEWPKLQKIFEEILPQVGGINLNQDPLEFKMNFNALASKWRSAGGNP